MQNMSGKSTFGLDANLVALLCYIANFVCYLGLILSIVTVIQDKTNKLARFHAFQSIFITVVLFAASIIFGIVYSVIFGIEMATIGFPIISLILGLVFGLIGLAAFIGMIIAAIKGYGGQIYKLPIVGNMADKYSN